MHRLDRRLIVQVRHCQVFLVPVAAVDRGLAFPATGCQIFDLRTMVVMSRARVHCSLLLNTAGELRCVILDALFSASRRSRRNGLPPPVVAEWHHVLAGAAAAALVAPKSAHQ